MDYYHFYQYACESREYAENDHKACSDYLISKKRQISIVQATR